MRAVYDIHSASSPYQISRWKRSRKDINNARYSFGSCLWKYMSVTMGDLVKTLWYYIFPPIIDCFTSYLPGFLVVGDMSYRRVRSQAYHIADSYASRLWNSIYVWFWSTLVYVSFFSLGCCYCFLAQFFFFLSFIKLWAKRGEKNRGN